MANADTNRKLAEAQAALHKLMTGKSAVKVSKDGMSVEYTPANIHELRSYIDELQRQANGAGLRRRPAGVSF